MKTKLFKAKGFLIALEEKGVMKKIIYLIISFGILISCASMKAAKQREEFRAYLSNQINIMTYDEALVNWGKPIELVQGDNIFVAKWGNETIGPRVVMPVGNMWVAGNPRHGWILQLSFDKRTKKLIAWKYNNW